MKESLIEKWKKAYEWDDPNDEAHEIGEEIEADLRKAIDEFEKEFISKIDGWVFKSHKIIFKKCDCDSCSRVKKFKEFKQTIFGSKVT